MKKDRAKSTILKISDFGILQLTRQRMRPSLRKAHFMPCPSCDGHGEIQMPESLSADVVRQVGYLLQFEKIRRLELVCSSQVASVLLSTKRRQLVRIEDVSGKRVDVRVSDAIAIDRIDPMALTRARLHLLPSARLLSFSCPAAAIRAFVRAGGTGTAPDPGAGPSRALVIRPDMAVEVRDLSAPAFALLNALVAGQTLDRALEAASAADGNTPDPAALLADLIVGQVFAGVDLTEGTSP